MSYLLDKKLKNKKMAYAGIGIFILIIGFYFSSPIGYFFSKITTAIVTPFWKIGINIKENFSSYSYLFKSKKALLAENQSLKEDMMAIQSDVSLNNVLLDENTKLKDILGRKTIKSVMILSNILSKPNRSLYDTLIIDIGENDGAVAGQNIFANGDILIGKVVEVYLRSSKVKLFSTSGEKTEVVLSGSDIYLSAVGRGGGAFEITGPRDLPIEKGTKVFLPGIDLKIVAVVTEIVSDQRDSFQKVLLQSPVNIQMLKWVEIEK